MQKKLIALGIGLKAQEHVIEVYGKEFFQNLVSDFSNLKTNIELFQKYQIDFYEEVFERYPELFICIPDELEKRLQKIIIEIGSEYQTALKEDLSILEQL